MTMSRKQVGQMLDAMKRYWQPVKLDAGPEQMMKAGGLLAVAVYLIGFCVVSLHLAKYGLFYFDPLRAQYFLAGFWCLFPVVFLLGFAILILMTVIEGYFSRETVEQIHPRRVLVLGVIICAAYLMPLLLVGRQLTGWGLVDWLRLFAMPFLLSSLIVTQASNEARLQEMALVRPQGYVATRKSFLHYMTLIYFVVHIFFFSADVFPKLPKSLGGGMPSPTQLVFENPEVAQRLAITTDSSGFVSSVYQVILETSTEVVLLSHDEGNAVTTVYKTQLMGMTSDPKSLVEGGGATQGTSKAER